MREVLIIDDSLTVRMDLDEAFRAAEWSSTLCASAVAAREALAHGAFDCVILDVLLPDGNGLDLLRELKSNPRTARFPVILLSTKAEVADQIKGMEVGADDYVGKPYDRAYVLSRAQHFAQAASQEEAFAPGTTILVVEDSPTFANSLLEALEQAGYRTVFARSGEEGLQLAAQKQPDAAIIDGLLPGIAGPTVIQRFKTDAVLRHIPCLLLTGSLSGQEEEVRSLESGADAFAKKDEGLAVVLARLRAMIRPAESPSEFSPRPTSVYGPKTILVVDDSETYRQEIADRLRRESYNVVLARSGPEALELLQVRPVDCILLDLIMPEMSGQEVCRKIKASPAWRFIPVIMLTGMEAGAAMLDGFNAGADDFVPKSCEFSILVARLRAQLRRRQFEEEAHRILDELRKKDFLVAQTRLIRESEQRMQMALQVSRAFAFDWEPATDEVVRSDSCSLILGCEGPDCGHSTGQQYLRLVHPADRERLWKAIADLKPGAETYQVEYRFLRGDGSTAVLEECARGFFDAEGKLQRLIGVTTDVSERKRTEAQLRAAQEELLRTNQELEQRVQERTAKLQEALEELEHFSYTITHDLRAPLRSMRGLGQIMAEECAACPHDERRDYLRRIVGAAGRMDQLITDALSYSRAAKLEQTLVPVDPAAVLQGILESYPHLQRPHAEISVDHPLPQVMGNEAGLVQCFANLLSNAVKFVEPGKVPQIHVRAEIVENGLAGQKSPAEPNTGAARMVRFWFEDNGIGISEEHQELIWRMFQRLDKKYEGTGIGLALVRKIVGRMGGQVGVQSEPGKGSQFWVELQLAQEKGSREAGSEI